MFCGCQGNRRPSGLTPFQNKATNLIIRFHIINGTLHACVYNMSNQVDVRCHIIQNDDALSHNPLKHPKLSARASSTYINNNLCMHVTIFTCKCKIIVDNFVFAIHNACEEHFLLLASHKCYFEDRNIVSELR